MTSLDTEPKRDNLPSLTGLRFYAAAVVLLRHTVPDFLPVPVVLQLSVIGPVGVSFFFVLSGFILTWGWRPGGRARDFYIRRAARIAPLHVLTTIAAVALAAAFGETLWFSAVISLLLLQAWGPESWRLGGNEPSWSLSCEAFFYVCFPALMPQIGALRSRTVVRLGLFVVGAMFVWTLGYALLTRIDQPAVTALSTYTNPVYRLGEFVIGICLAVLIRRGWRCPLSLQKAILLAAISYCTLAAVNEAWAQVGPALGEIRGLPLSVHALLYLPATVLLVAAAASSDLEGRRSPVAGDWHLRLGAWSFALYLIQIVIVSTAQGLVPRPLAWPAGGAVMVAVWLVSLAAAAALYALFERPVERWIRGRFPSGVVRRDGV